MKKLLKFVDDYVFETQLYFRVDSLYKQEEYEVQWQHGACKRWRLKPVSSESWTEVDSDLLIDRLNEAKLNISSFELMLRSNILQQVAYAETFLRRAGMIFGKETIDEAIQVNKEFVKELEGTIRSLLGQEHQETLATPPMEMKSLGVETGRIGPTRIRALQAKDTGRSKGFLRLLGEGTDFSLEPRGIRPES